MSRPKTITIIKSESARQEERIVLEGEEAKLIWKLAKELNKLRRRCE
jgi:hypothetical protein